MKTKRARDMYLSALKNKQKVVAFTQTIGLMGFLFANTILILNQVENVAQPHFNAMLAVCGVLLATVTFAALHVYKRSVAKAPPGKVVNDFQVTLLTELSKTATVSASIMYFLESAAVYTQSLEKPISSIPMHCWIITLIVVFITTLSCKAIDVASKPDE